jgi:Deoxycytidylate deaminase
MKDRTDVTNLIAPLKKLAKVSKAKLCGVACFIVKNGAVISSGINHHPNGGPMEKEIDGKLVTCPEVLHAEITALQLAEKNRIDLTDSAILLNMAPCINCAKEIAKTDISELYYLHDWWDKASLDVLKDNGIKVHKIKEEK